MLDETTDAPSEKGAELAKKPVGQVAKSNASEDADQLHPGWENSKRSFLLATTRAALSDDDRSILRHNRVAEERILSVGAE